MSDIAEKTRKQQEDLFSRRETDEARVLGYFQRFNMAGLDYNGQVSTSQAESGTKLSGSATFDFSKVLAVPFCHAKLSLSASKERVAHSVMVMQRLARRVWKTEVRLPSPSAGTYGYALSDGTTTTSVARALHDQKRQDWVTNRPVLFAHLEGKTGRTTKKIEAKAYAGLTANFDDDETGLSIGAGASRESGSQTTFMADDEVRHFGTSAYDGALADYVDDVLSRDLLQKAAIWIVQVTGGEASFKTLGYAGKFLDLVAENEFIVGKMAAKAEGQTVKGAKAIIGELENKATANRIDDLLPSQTLKSLAHGLARMASDMVSKLKKQKQTKKAQLDEADMRKRVLEVQTALRSGQKWWSSQTALPQDQRQLRFADAELEDKLETLSRHLLEAEDLLRMLDRIDTHGAGNLKASVAPTKVNWPAPLCFLTLHADHRWFKLAVGANINLPFKLLGANAVALSRWGRRTIGFRFQSFVRGASASGGATYMVNTQDARVRYDLRVMEAKAKASAGRGRKSADAKATTAQWATMTYEALTGTWEMGDPTDKIAEILPNLSGRSFGMSILAGRFQEYALFCKTLVVSVPGPGAAGPAPNPVPTEDMQALEDTMMKILRVTQDELRRFMAESADLIGENPKEQGDNARYQGLDAKERKALVAGTVTSDVSVLVEANFQLTRKSHIVMSGGVLSDLGTLPEFRVHDNNLKNGQQDRGNGLRLSAIRLRHRIAAEDNNGHETMALGFSVTPAVQLEGKNPFELSEEVKEQRNWFQKLFDLDPTRSTFGQFKMLIPSFGLKWRKVSCVSAEGLFDLHVAYFPEDPFPNLAGAYKKSIMADRARTNLAEISVSPAMLFSQ